MDIAGNIDHTLLAPETTPEMVANHCAEAARLDVYAVCVPPTYVHLAKELLPSHIKVATVCGYPTGQVRTEVKALEARLAVEDGADEIDVVMNIGAARAQNWTRVEEDLQAVRDAAPEVLLKVIVESSVLTPQELTRACESIEKISAEQAKTSTGTHPQGGATEEAVQLMRQSLPEQIGIKASGGIRTREDARRMLEAGAIRLGTSATRRILTGTQREASEEDERGGY